MQRFWRAGAGALVLLSVAAGCSSSSAPDVNPAADTFPDEVTSIAARAEAGRARLHADREELERALVTQPRGVLPHSLALQGPPVIYKRKVKPQPDWKYFKNYRSRGGCFPPDGVDAIGSVGDPVGVIGPIAAYLNATMACGGGPQTGSCQPVSFAAGGCEAVTVSSSSPETGHKKCNLTEHSDCSTACCQTAPVDKGCLDQFTYVCKPADTAMGYDFTRTCGIGQHIETDPLNGDVTDPAAIGDCVCNTGTLWVPELVQCVAYDDIDPPPCDTCAKVGNPIAPLRGAKVESIDLGFSIGSVPVVLTYDSEAASLSDETSPLGPRWSSSLHRTTRTLGKIVAFTRGDGTAVSFETQPDRSLVPDYNVKVRAYGTGWPKLYDPEQGTIEVYNGGPIKEIDGPDGSVLTFSYTTLFGVSLLSSVTENWTGRQVRFAYGKRGVLGDVRLTSVFDLAGREITLDYTDSGMDWPSLEQRTTFAMVFRRDFHYRPRSIVSKLTWPDQTSRTFHYDHRSPEGLAEFAWALTSITDEKGVTYASFRYDEAGRAISTEHAGGVEAYKVDYTGGYVSAHDLLDTTLSSPRIRRYRGNQLGSAPTVTTPEGAASAWATTSVDPSSNALPPPRLTGQSQPAGAGCAASSAARTLDAAGNVTSVTDFRGNVTCFAYDPVRNLEIARFEGLPPGTDCGGQIASTVPPGSRQITTQWHPFWNKPVVETAPGVRRTFVYNLDVDPARPTAGKVSCAGTLAMGVPCREVEEATTDSDGHLGVSAVVDTTVAPRVWTWSYNSLGQVQSETDPVANAAGGATPSKTFTYYATAAIDHAQGDLATVTNVLKQTTRFLAYDPGGAPLTVQAPNGVVSTFTYDAVGRLETASRADLKTTYAYWPTGLVKSVSPPSGATLSFDYDDAHRLRQVTDAFGNHADITPRSSDGPEVREVYDAAGRLVRQRVRAYDPLGRLQSEIGR